MQSGERQGLCAAWTHVTALISDRADARHAMLTPRVPHVCGGAKALDGTNHDPQGISNPTLKVDTRVPHVCGGAKPLDWTNHDPQDISNPYLTVDTPGTSRVWWS